MEYFLDVKVTKEIGSDGNMAIKKVNECSMDCLVDRRKISADGWKNKVKNQAYVAWIR